MRLCCEEQSLLVPHPARLRAGVRVQGRTVMSRQRAQPANPIVSEQPCASIDRKTSLLRTQQYWRWACHWQHMWQVRGACARQHVHFSLPGRHGILSSLLHANLTPGLDGKSMIFGVPLSCAKVHGASVLLP
eukprot:scaffold467_cov403-Prasinococcus_capsulatus_cf.AAC.17